LIFTYSPLKRISVNYPSVDTSQAASTGWYRAPRAINVFHVLDEVLREVKAIREKTERVEEIIEERLIGVEEPSADEKKRQG
jgi:hypothetical protein